MQHDVEANPNGISETPHAPTPPPAGTFTRGSAFWLSFVAVMVTVFLSAMDLTALSTVLPTITSDLKGESKFVWIGSAYALASTAILPLTGSLADIFGRRPVMLGAISLFTLGSALAGSAQNMNWLIAARTIQGMGGGGIINMTEIIVADLVPLNVRGLYQGMIVMVWAFASAVGPPIGGALAEKASWRWLFYINLPLSGISMVLVLAFLRVRTPPGSMKEKLARVDWIGNAIVIVGTSLTMIGLAWGGVRYPWSSAHVLAPLLLGLALIAAFIFYEAKVPKEPTIPWKILNNRTSLSGFFGTAIHGITSISAIYYVPVYFQAAFKAGPIRSGVDILPMAAFIAPMGFVAGAVVHVTKKYKPVNYVGWISMVIGFGLMTLLRANSSQPKWVGYQILAAAGFGIIYPATVFPVLAPLEVEQTAAAIAFYNFLRSFAQTWGITISATILQNQLKIHLPSDFTSQFPAGVDIAYAVIPQIPSLPEPFQTQVRVAFADSLSTIWKVMIGIAGLGLLSVPFMREIAMRAFSDEKYALQDSPRRGESPQPENIAEPITKEPK